MYHNEFGGLPRGTSAVKWSADGKVAVMLEGSVCILQPSGGGASRVSTHLEKYW